MMSGLRVPCRLRTALWQVLRRSRYRLGWSSVGVSLCCRGPYSMTNGFSVGVFVVKGIEAAVKRGKKGPVSELIDHWNHVCPEPISGSSWSCHWLCAYFAFMAS